MVGFALQAAIMAFPAIKDWIGDGVSHGVGLLILAGIALARLKAQSETKP